MIGVFFFWWVGGVGVGLYVGRKIWGTFLWGDLDQDF